MISELSIHDSGVRRFTRSASTRLRRLLAYVIPMRKKPSTKNEAGDPVEEVDKARMAKWAGIAGLIVYVVNAIQSSNPVVNERFDRLEKRMVAIEDKRERDMERIEGKFDTFIKTINEYRPSVRK